MRFSASLSSAKVRRAQVHTAIVELDVRASYHVTSHPGPTGYLLLHVTFDPLDGMDFGEPEYPTPRPFRLEVIDEVLSVHAGRVVVRTPFVGRRREDFALRGQVTYRACDDRKCYFPQHVEFPLPLTYLDHEA